MTVEDLKKVLEAVPNDADVQVVVYDSDSVSLPQSRENVRSIIMGNGYIALNCDEIPVYKT